ncbi:hypothetical protein R1flu_002286 [Riccia fluitans]|uniref:Uncharacterized protein n=1 Tax=Riccia fluitans TaxID=41844 RepID=A0ABD1Y623_9MARC
MGEAGRELCAALPLFFSSLPPVSIMGSVFLSPQRVHYIGEGPLIHVPCTRSSTGINLSSGCNLWILGRKG